MRTRSILASLLLAVAFLIPLAAETRDALETPRTCRYRIASLLSGGRTVRDAELVAAINAQVTKGSLAAIDASTFGLFANARADASCSITSGAAVLTALNDNWTSADVGKLIDVAGAGSAGGTLRSRIKTFTNSKSVTLWDNAATTVAASKTSAGGLACWGDELTATTSTPVNANSGGTQQQSATTLTVLASRSSAARSLAARFADVANVLDFGAAGNGTTDDTSAIQRAVDSGAGRVVFPAGRYRTTATITITSACMLEGIATGLATTPGTNVGATITQAYIIHDHSGTCFDFTGGTADDRSNAGSGIRKLSLVQQHGDGTGASGIAIRSVAVSNTQRCNWLTFEDVQVCAATGKNQWEYGIYLDGTAASDLIRDVWIRGGRIACAAPGTAAMRIAGVANLFVNDHEANLDRGDLTITGDATHKTAGIYISNSSYRNLTFDYAWFGQVIGGQVSTFETTANAQSITAVGCATGVSGPTLAGTNMLFIGRDASNVMQFKSTANTWSMNAGLASIEVESVLRPKSVIRMNNATNLAARNAADSDDIEMVQVSAGNRVVLAPSGDALQFGSPARATGGGAGATMGTIGGSGPTAAAQAGWLEVYDAAGNKRFIPVWQ